ncbi:hypothetical protein L3Q82_003742 [Scortum barcoo]|uniref:Uncharacterized protein n=1 Tax=Scortum barcoo TaxID=214431 RepID=A0ACB8X645_9TELE|nr:hypothetical protein L3Q82_003742 [Scortum barcoo]
MAQKFLILLVLLSAAASAEDVVEVKPGEDAVLRCEAGDVSIRAVEWTRDDLKSEEYVLLYRNGKPDTTFQHQSFRGRVQLVDADLKNGDVSLILKNVNINDAGTYECQVAAGSKRTKRANIDDPPIRSIRLEVKEWHRKGKAQEDHCPPVITRADVCRTLKRINTRKAPGPDGIPGRALKVCADQLADVFADIFNLSLLQSVVPTCFKETIIVPVPKKTKILCLNDDRPVALTSTIMKCFERLVKSFITSSIPDSLDPLQFAYRPNRSTEDAIALTLHTALSHLDQRDTYVRMLFH